MRALHFLMGSMLAVSIAFGQSDTTKDVSAPAAGTVAAASESKDIAQIKGIALPSPLTVQHSLSFGMGTGFGASSLQYQGFYNTMMQYRFSAPVTVNLNFGLPLVSNYSPYQTPSAKNIQSMDYFKSIPFDVGVNWKPSENVNLNFSIINRPYSPYGMYNYGMFPWR